LLKSIPHSRVYLRCEPEVLHRRIHEDPATVASRPPLTDLGGGIEEIRTLMNQREPLYREVMTTELDVTNLEIDEVVVRVAKLV
jgi:shikimate kinase